MSDEWVLSVDIGSTYTKAALIDTYPARRIWFERDGKAYLDFFSNFASQALASEQSVPSKS